MMDQQLSNDLAQFLSNPSLQKALADGSLDLTSYSDQVQEELQLLEQDCIAVYRDKSLSDIPTLSYELQECDLALASLQEMLCGLQADLSAVSGDLRQLQETSKTLSTQCHNRRVAQEGLQLYLQHVVVAPTLVHTLCRGTVPSPMFAEAICELQDLYRNTHHNNNNTNNNSTTASLSSTIPSWSCGTLPAHTRAAQEQQTRIDTLVQVAVVRIRDYFVSQLLILPQHPQTNVRMLQVHGLIQYTALQEFVQTQAPHVSDELFDLYVEIMSKTLYALFRTYQAQLYQLDMTKQHVTRLDVIAMDDALLRDAVTTKAKKRNDCLALSNRLRVLEQSGSGSGGSSGGGSGGHVASSPSSSQQHHHQQQQQQQHPSHGKATPSSHHPSNTSHNNNNSNTSSNSNNPVIMAHVALAEHSKYHYEMLFRSLLQHLLDAVTNEHVVCRQFFHRDAFSKLFPPTLSLLSEQLENYLFTCHDAICLLLLIKVTHVYQRMAKARRITSLDPWYEQITKLVWPRLKMVMDSHMRSLQTATVRSLGGVDLHAHYVSRRFAEFTCSLLLILHNHPSSSSSTSSSSSGSVTNHIHATTSGGGGGGGNHHPSHRMNPSSTSPTGSTPKALFSRRSSGVTSDAGSGAASANPSSSITPQPLASPLPMSGGGGTPTSMTTSSRHAFTSSYSSSSAGDKLLQDLANLQDEFILLLERLSESHSTTKQRVVFMINNLDQIVCLFQERRVAGKELNRFVELLMAQRELFVEEELLQTFSKMIAFVHQTESHLRSAAMSSSMASSNPHYLENLVNAQVVEALVRDFSSTWKSGMEQINKNVLSYFSNFRNGMEILKQVLTQLLLYYTRFQEIIRKVWRNKPPAFCRDLVSTNVILTEIKKYALAI